nr:hypothetical protein [uncultured Roseococcus sp.]
MRRPALTFRWAALSALLIMPLPALAKDSPSSPPTPPAAAPGVKQANPLGGQPGTSGPQALEPGQAIRVRLNGRETRTFRISPAAGSDYTIITRSLSNGTDTVLYLLGDRGQRIGSDDDGGDEPLSSRMEVTSADRGTAVRVGTFGGGGEFEILLTRDTPRGRPDFATTLDAARTMPALAVDAPRRVRLLRREQAFFALPEDTRDFVALTRGLRRGTDTVLALVNAQGRVLAEDDDGGDEPLASRLDFARGQGPLFLRASVFSGTGGEFEVLLQAEAPSPPPSYATTLIDAAGRPPLEIGQTVRIELRRRQAAYFALPGGDMDLRALTRNLSNGADTVISLVDGNGQVVMSDDDGGEEDLSSQLDIPAPRRQVFLQVTLLGPRPGSFDLTLQQAEPAAAPNFATSPDDARAQPPLPAGEARRIRLERGQSAYFVLPPSDQPRTILTRNLRRGTDTVLELLDAHGQMIDQDDDGGEGLASRLAVPAGGQGLVIRAGVFGDGSGEFELILN